MAETSTPPSAVTLSETDRNRISGDVAEHFIDSYYTALSGARNTISSYYVPVATGSTPARTLPYIAYNGDLTQDPDAFQEKFKDMPWTYYEIQSFNASVLNPCLDPSLSKTKKDAERNMSITVQCSGYLRLNERKDGPMHGFADTFVLVPNKEEVGGRGTGKQGQGRQWLIQTQTFRFVV
jgi:NTF2-related export protein 1/2